MPDTIFSSFKTIAYEGPSSENPLSYRWYDPNRVVNGKPLKDHLEAIGHRDALHFVRALAAAGEPVREIDIREIHRLVVARVDPEEAGRYSRHQRPPLRPMRDWLQFIRSATATAAAAHAR